MSDTILNPTNGAKAGTRVQGAMMNLRELAELYAVEYVRFKNLSPRTEENYLTAIASFTNVIGLVTITDLTFEHVKKWHSYMMTNNYSVGTIRNHLSRLKNLLIWSNRKGLTDFPVEYIEYPKTPVVPPRFIDPEDVATLIDVTPDLRNKTIISMLYASGLRSSELSGLNRSSVKGLQLQIRGKGQKYRIGFIDSRTEALLGAYLQTRTDRLPPLFITCRQTRIDKSLIERVVKQAVQAAGFDESITPHTLRHGYATNLLRNGCNLRIIQELLGHSSITTTQLYTHVFSTDLQERYQKFHTN